MNKQKTPTIGIIFPDFLDSYQTDIWEGIRVENQKFGYRLLTFNGGSLNYRDRRHVYRNQLYELVNSNNVDVLLLISAPLFMVTDQKGITEFISRYNDIPIISIGVTIPDIKSILVDNADGIRQLVTHLIEDHDCKRIAFVKGSDKNEEANIRFKAYRDTLKAYHIPYDPKLVCPGSFIALDGKKAVETILNVRKTTLDAIIGIDDEVAMYAMETLFEYGINVPETVKVCGFDDINKSQFITPALTTIRQPVSELGRRAIQAANRILTNQTVPDILSIPCTMIKRESCGCSTDYDFHNDNLYRRPIITHDLSSFTDKTISSLTTYIKTAQQDIYYYFTDSELQSLIIVILDGITEESPGSLIPRLDKQFTSIFNKKVVYSFWNNFFNDICTTLRTYECYEKYEQNIKIVRQYIKSWFDDRYIKYLTYKNMQQKDFSNDIQGFGENLLTCYSFNELKSALDMTLPYFNINYFFIITYDEAINKSQRIYALTPDETELPMYDFPNTALLPDDYPVLAEVSLVFLPLVTEKNPTGYIVCELTDIDDSVYDFLAQRIAGVLKGIMLLDEVTKHAHVLEEKVNERTMELKKMNNLLRTQAFQDQLSGLYNRHFLMKVILPEIDKMIKVIIHMQTQTDNRKASNHIAVIMADIDHFKSINDEYGHDSGDIFLKEISRILCKHVRSDDYIIRMGGEEFLIILKNFDQPSLTEKIDQIRNDIAQTKFVMKTGETIRRTCSFGAAIFPLAIQNQEKINFLSTVSLADKGLYRAKQTGRNRGIIIYYTQDFFTSDHSINDLLIDIDAAVNNGLIFFETIN